VNHIIRVAGETAKLGRVWPHMLPQLRLLPGRQGHRSAHDAGLPRAP
jgi:hypothetical protein